MSQPTHQPSPQLFFDTVNAYQRSASLKAAIELDLFSLIGKGKNTARDLAAAWGASERGARILCDYLVVIGFLLKEGQSYRLTADSAVFLDRNSPGYIGSSIEFLLSPMLTSAFQDVAASVRRGGTVLSEDGTVSPEHPIWVRFARAMAPMMELPAQLIANLVNHSSSSSKMKILDIAAGHGVFGIKLAQANPNAEIVAVDWPGVLEVAKENAALRGVSDRYRTLPGSAFDVDYGTGYDLVLLTNFLHHFDQPTCEELLRKVHTALGSAGRAVTLEFVPNEDRVSPPGPAAFSMMMLGTTPSGDAYTFSEYQRMFSNSGFSRSELHPLPPTLQQAVLSYK
jgi:ubiquinone/menaquinone biosynthesis C-methylase UbiE